MRRRLNKITLLISTLALKNFFLVKIQANYEYTGDSTLSAGLKNRDKKVFFLLVERNSKLMYNYGNTLMFAADSIIDCGQDAFFDAGTCRHKLNDNRTN